MRSIFGGIAFVLIVTCVSVRAVSVNELVMGKTEAGPNHALKDLKGKAVLVVFWGTH